MDIWECFIFDKIWVYIYYARLFVPTLIHPTIDIVYNGIDPNNKSNRHRFCHLDILVKYQYLNDTIIFKPTYRFFDTIFMSIIDIMHPPIYRLNIGFDNARFEFLLVVHDQQWHEIILNRCNVHTSHSCKLDWSKTPCFEAWVTHNQVKENMLIFTSTSFLFLVGNYPIVIWEYLFHLNCASSS